MNPIDWLSPAGVFENGLAVLENGFAVRLTQTLAHFVWQGAACGALAVLAAAGLRRRSARLRYGVHVAALVLMLVCLPITFALVPAAGAGFDGDRLAREAGVNALAPVEAPSREEPLIRPPVEPTSRPTWPAPAETSPAGSIAARAEEPGVDAGPAAAASPRALDTADDEANTAPVLWLPVRIAPYTAGLYLLGVVLMLARLAVAVWGAHRLWRSASPLVEGELLMLVDRVARRIGMKAAPAVAWCARVPVPVVVGIFRPIILLPGSLATGMNPSQLEALLIHELAHIRRYDLLVNLMQRVVESLLFFHPAVWYVSRRISIERENCCDDSVLDSGCARVAYADALVRMAELCTLPPSAAGPGNAAVLAASGGGPSQFKRRVLRVLGREIGPGLQLTRGALLAALLLPAVFLLALAVMQLPAGSEEGGQRAAESADAADAADDAIRIRRLVSPDGQRIAYGQFTVGPQGETGSRVIVADADLTNRRSIDVELEQSHEVLWYGNDLLAVSPVHDATEYLLISPADGTRQGTLKLPDACDVLYKRLSPDGQRVAYVGRFHRNRDKDDVLHGMFVVDLKKGTVEQVLSEAVKTAPAWSPDSTRLAIGAAGGYKKDYPLAIVTLRGAVAGPQQRPASSAAGATSFWQIITGGGDVTKLGTSGVGVDWSPDGRFLAFTTAIIAGGSWHHGVPLDGRIGVWDLEREQLTLVSQPAQHDYDRAASRREYAGSAFPVWSPDSRWIAYQHKSVLRTAGTETQESLRIGTETQQESVWIVERDGTSRRKVLDHAADVAWSNDSRALVWVHEGRSGRVDLENLSDLGETPARPTGPFSVRGRVTDADGQPLSGVEIRVARGWRSLRTTAPVRTNDEGRYEIHFGVGMLLLDDPVNLQSALVSAWKPGYYEKTLGEQGRLGMAYQKPPQDAKAEDQFRDIVYPGHPYELDLVMIPAARLEGTLVDGAGQPLANYKLTLDGDKLYAASSILASLETDENGRFSFDRVPLHPYHFTLGGKSVSISSQPLPFERPQKYVVQLVYDSLAGTLTWELRAEEPQEANALITAEARTAIERGLLSLMRSQQEDGAIGSGKGYRKNVAVTALAGIAFLAAGSTPERGAYAEPLRKCRDFVLNQARRDGYITNQDFSSHGPMYEHAYATQFLAVLQQRHPTDAVRDKLQSAVNLLVGAQNDEGGWRYEPDSKSSDISVTACQTVALELAALAGASVPKDTLERALAYIRKCQNADGGFRYQLVNRAESRFPRSAAALLALELSLPQGDELAAARAYVQRFKPSADELKYEPHFLYGHRYAALAVQQAGGDAWQEWYAAIRDVLLQRQNADGTWPGDAVCPEYGTANACIILQLPVAGIGAAAAHKTDADAQAEQRTIRLRFHSSDGERRNEDEPIGGLQALVWRNDAAGRVSTRPRTFRPEEVVARGTTDENGAVPFQLAPGDYYVRWTSDKELPYPQTQPRPFEVKPAPAEQEQGFGLTKGCTLLLKAVDAETGRGIPGVRFWWENDLGEYWTQTVRPDHLGRPPHGPAEEAYQTDANGEYRLYWFRASEDTFGVDAGTLPEGYELVEPSEVQLNFRDETTGRFRSGQTIEHTFVLARKDAAEPPASE